MRASITSTVLIALVLGVAVSVAPPAAGGAQVIPVRGGQVVVPDFDPRRYHDSDSCQASLNSALAALSRQLAEIPFPPPGEPGYHEWANAIREQMTALNATRGVCLRLGAPGRLAPRAQARRFGVVAVPVARQLTALRTAIARAGAARKGALGLRALGIAVGLDGRIDLEALRNRQSFARSNVGNTRIPSGQLKQLPGFAAAVQDISDWDREVVELTERRAATDPDLAQNLDLLANHRFGRPYSQLTLAERRDIVTLPGVRSQSGAIQVLLDRVRKAAAAGGRVIFGGRR